MYTRPRIITNKIPFIFSLILMTREILVSHVFTHVKIALKSVLFFSV